jgi:hypothetical protein
MNSDGISSRLLLEANGGLGDRNLNLTSRVAKRMTELQGGRRMSTSSKSSDLEDIRRLVVRANSRVRAASASFIQADRAWALSNGQALPAVSAALERIARDLRELQSEVAALVLADPTALEARRLIVRCLNLTVAATGRYLEMLQADDLRAVQQIALQVVSLTRNAEAAGNKAQQVLDCHESCAAVL